MKITKLHIGSKEYPQPLQDITDPPKQLYYIGDLEAATAKPRLAIVGSRKVPAYGKAVTLRLAREATEQGIVIVSGLALGVDGLAHQAALEANGTTIAVLPTSLSKIYPSSHHQLAKQILKKGGILITEYGGEVEPHRGAFIARNRIISGLSDATLITEAAIKSGSLHTANFALDQGRTVMTVPGNITSELSAGTNNLIKAGAVPITEIRDILAAMNLTQAIKREAPIGSTEEETIILSLLVQGISDASELLARSGLEPQLFNQSLTMLEITGKVRPLGAGHWSLS